MNFNPFDSRSLYSDYDTKKADWRAAADKSQDYATIQNEGMKYAKDLARGNIQQGALSTYQNPGMTAAMRAQIGTQAGTQVPTDQGYNLANTAAQAQTAFKGTLAEEEAHKAAQTQDMINTGAQLVGTGMKTVAGFAGQKIASQQQHVASHEGYDDYSQMLYEKGYNNATEADDFAKGTGFGSYAQMSERAHRHGFGSAEQLQRALSYYGLEVRG